MAVLDGKIVVAQVEPNAELAGKPLEVPLDLNNWREDKKYTLRLTIEAKEGKLNSKGRFEVEPLLPPENALLQVAVKLTKTAMPSVAKGSATTASGTTWLSEEQAVAWYQKIGDQLLEAAQGKENVATLLAEETLRAKLAKHETLRVCSSDRLVAIAARPQRVAFLKAFFADTEWMESFLTGGPADCVAAIENLRFV